MSFVAPSTIARTPAARLPVKFTFRTLLFKRRVRFDRLSAGRKKARAALTRFIPDVVLVDLNLPDGSGLDLLQNLPAQPPGGALPVIVMTGNATVESAIEGLRHGIWDYLLKPVNIPRLRSLLARIPRPYELTEEVQTLRATLRQLVLDTVLAPDFRRATFAGVPMEFP